MNKWDSNNLESNEQPRLKNLSRNDLDDSIKSIYDSIINSERGVGTLSDGSLPGPFNAWLYADYEMAKSLDNIGVAISSGVFVNITYIYNWLVCYQPQWSYVSRSVIFNKINRSDILRCFK